MNEESYTESATAAFLSNDIQRPPRNAPSDSDGVIMVLSAEYYLDAHRNEIICHQVWTGKTDRGQTKVRILTNQGTGWIVGGGSDEFVTFTEDEARRCWNHSVDNGATRVYMRVKSKQSSKYGITADSDSFQESVYQKTLNKFANLYKYDEDPKSYKELAKEDAIWENYALEA